MIITNRSRNVAYGTMNMSMQRCLGRDWAGKSANSEKVFLAFAHVLCESRWLEFWIGFPQVVALEFDIGIHPGAEGI
jgi:hypothetical protein